MAPNTSLKDTERPIRCELGHLISPNLHGEQVLSLSDKYSPKWHFIRDRAKGRFYQSLVRIVLIIGSELDIMKKSLTTRESTYIELIFHEKISVLV